jgi:hypothetical protein
MRPYAMIPPEMRTRIVLSSLALAASLVVGCGSSSSNGTTTTVTAPATSAAPAAPTTTTATSTTSSGSTSGVDGVPAYQPSDVVSQAPNSLVLSSTDTAAKVGAFYAAKLTKDGWVTVSKAVTPTSVSFAVKKSGQGASVVVATSGSGSSVSISTHPQP